MKRLVIALALLFPLLANAEIKLERYRQQNETQQLVLTEEACKLSYFTPTELETLFKAYALNIPTSEQYEGCWQKLDNGTVKIQIIIAEEKKVFVFTYPQSDFELRPNL